MTNDSKIFSLFDVTYIIHGRKQILLSTMEEYVLAGKHVEAMIVAQRKEELKTLEKELERIAEDG